MRKPRNFKAGYCYHLVSRIAHRAFFFDAEEKDRFVDLLMRVECFSGVRLLGYCVMSNHVHIYLYLEVGHAVGDEELLDKIKRLYRGARLEELLHEWRTLKASSDGTLAGGSDFARFRQSFINRMFDPSEFMKTLKHHYTVSYNGRRDHCGTMWEGRFRQRETRPVTKEMSAVAAYIDCNPCEGGLCSQPTEYRWSSWTAARQGDEHCRAMYRFIYGEDGEGEQEWRQIVWRHEVAIRHRLGEIVDDKRSGNKDDGIFGLPIKADGAKNAGRQATNAAGADPIAAPNGWQVRLDRGSNAVAARILEMLKVGDKSAGELAVELGIKCRAHLSSFYLGPLMARGLVRQTIPDKPKSRFQRYALVRHI